MSLHEPVLIGIMVAYWFIVRKRRRDRRAARLVERKQQ